MGSQDWAHPDEVSTEDLIRLYRGDDISIRAFSRQSGIPYSTLQGIISGTTGRMSPTTRARIEDFLEHVPPTVQERASPQHPDEPPRAAGRPFNDHTHASPAVLHVPPMKPGTDTRPGPTWAGAEITTEQRTGEPNDVAVGIAVSVGGDLQLLED